jgi:hypothetical protein
MVHSSHKHDAISGNSSWRNDWMQWGFDHYNPKDLGEYDYYRYIRYTKELPKKSSDQWLSQLNGSNNPKAQNAASYYNGQKAAHAEFYREIREKEEQEKLRIELEQQIKAIEDEKKKAEEKILADQQKVINQIPVTPISDIPVTISSPINNDEVPKGYHRMPDGTIMKGSKHKTEREKLVEKTSISILVIGAIGLYLALRFKS